MSMNMAVRKLNKVQAWYVDICYERKRYRLKSPINSKRDAETYEHEIMEKLLAGKPLTSEPEKENSFEVFSQEWYTTYVLVNSKYSYQLSIKNTLDVHLKPYFGKMKLQEITSKTIEQFKRKQLTLGLNPKTINNHLGALSKMLHSAVEWGELDTIPVMKALKGLSKETRTLTDEECARLLSDHTDPTWRLMVLVGLNTGCRLGELSGLRWENIDFEQHTINVKQSIVRGRITSPKNHKSRILPMTKLLDNTLYAIKKPSGWVFEQSDNDLNIAKRAADGLARMCRRANIKRIGWHALRHTFATQLAMRGVPLYYIQKLLGHSSITMTERYSHFSSDVLHDAVTVLDDLSKGLRHSQGIQTISGLVSA
jgi:integrase